MTKVLTKLCKHSIECMKVVLYFVISINLTACKYEAAEQVETGQAIIGQENEQPVDNSSASVSAGGSTTDSLHAGNSGLVLPEISQCDGECTCDEVLVNLNDTGVVASAESATANLSTCSFSILLGQDCSYGRDAQLSLDKVGAGNGGFDFSKISADGTVLAEDAIEWQCVLDNHTGLMWEVKKHGFSGEIGNKTNTFSWYMDEVVDYSTANNGICNLTTSCDTKAYIEAINNNQMCGYDDWRLPNKTELQDLVDYGSSRPSIDDSFFPQTMLGFYWSSSIDSDDFKSAWQIGFFYGRVAGIPTESPRYIRLVREHQKKAVVMPVAGISEQNMTIRRALAPRQNCNSQAESSAPTTRFKQDNQGNILDRFTGLIWKRCVEGLLGEFCDQGEELKMSWTQALMYTEKVNNEQTEVLTSSWRLPNIKELQSTIETQCEEPALNPFAFPNVPLENVWSGTPHNHNVDNSYYLQYQNSVVFFTSREEELLVHLVRDCQ
ncbi:DUF1566 domain-containing protein [Colwelliaceae bacterium MEBiC 14330]